jgi:hypothetical protein
MGSLQTGILIVEPGIWHIALPDITLSGPAIAERSHRFRWTFIAGPDPRPRIEFSGPNQDEQRAVVLANRLIEHAAHAANEWIGKRFKV